MMDLMTQAIMKTSKLIIPLATLAATLTLLPACSSTPLPAGVTETDFTVSGGYTNPDNKETYTGSATTAVKYAPASPNVPSGATAAGSASTAPSSNPQPSPTTPNSL